MYSWPEILLINKGREQRQLVVDGMPISYDATKNNLPMRKQVERVVVTPSLGKNTEEVERREKELRLK